MLLAQALPTHLSNFLLCLGPPGPRGRMIGRQPFVTSTRYLWLGPVQAPDSKTSAIALKLKVALERRCSRRGLWLGC